MCKKYIFCIDPFFFEIFATLDDGSIPIKFIEYFFKLLKKVPSFDPIQSDFFLPLFLNIFL